MLRLVLTLSCCIGWSEHASGNPGGYAGSESEGQFEICDDRSVEEILMAIKSKGYYPVFKDWADTFGGNK